MGHYDVAEVREALIPEIESIVKDLYPEGRREGNELRCDSVEGGKGRSFCISLNGSKMGQWLDHATGEGGDLFTLIQKKDGVSFGEAVAYLAEKYTSCTEKTFNSYGVVKKPVIGIDPDPITRPLNKEDLDYAKHVRHISEDMLCSYGVRGGNKSELAFLYWVDSKCVKVHYTQYINKDFRSTKDPGSTLWGKEYATPDRCQGKLIITEGQWDALSYASVGLPAVSVPSGVSNLKWLDTDWEYLQQFHTVYVSTDMDEKGREMAKKIVSRLGPNKCNIVDLCEKDASDMLQMLKHKELVEAIENAKPRDPEELSAPSKLAKDAWRDIQGEGEQGVEMFIDLPDFKIRKHEYTVVTGFEGSGKSCFTINQLVFMMSLGEQGTVASLEMPGHKIIRDIAVQIHGSKDFQSEEEFMSVIELTEDLLQIYDTTDKVDHKKLIDVFEYLHKRYGVWFFIIDNLATLDTGRDDFSAQTELANDIRALCKNYPIHIMVVAHPKKPMETGKHPGPPVGSDVRGASEIIDYADNLIVIWRNKAKPELIQNMIKAGTTKDVMEKTINTVEDGKFVIRKQRETGVLGSYDLFYNQELKIFNTTSTPHAGFKYYFPKES